MPIYGINLGKVYRITTSDWVQLFPVDDEYWTALEWLTERGWL